MAESAPKMRLPEAIAQLFARSASVPGFVFATIASLYVRYGLMEQAATQQFEASGAKAALVPLDLRFAYSPADVRTLFAQMGRDGVDLYAHFLTTYDLIYPLTYLLMIGWALALLVRKQPRKVILLAPGIFLFDMLENSTIVAMAHIYPRFSDGLALAASIFTSAKWIMVVLAFAALLWLGFGRIAEALGRKSDQQQP